MPDIDIDDDFPEKKKVPLRSFVGKIILTILFAISFLSLNVFILSLAVTKKYSIASSSMKPSLAAGDYVVTVPYIYNVILGRKVNYGDIITFAKSYSSGETYIKRVVGLPGDIIGFSNGVLSVNGRSALLEGTSSPDDLEKHQLDDDEFREVLPNGKYYDVVGFHGYNAYAYMKGVIVPPDHVFVAGDNRPNSLDSRPLPQGRGGSLGFIPIDQIQSRAILIIFSLKEGHFWEVWRWPQILRGDRLLKRVE